MRPSSSMIYWYILNFTPTYFSNSLPSSGDRITSEATQAILVDLFIHSKFYPNMFQKFIAIIRGPYYLRSYSSNIAWFIDTFQMLPQHDSEIHCHHQRVVLPQKLLKQYGLIYWYIPNFTPTCFSNSLPSSEGRITSEAIQAILLDLLIHSKCYPNMFQQFIAIIRRS
jgi:hypothetical protein